LHTFNICSEIADDIPDEVELLLTNTLYFKDAWTKPFEKMPLDIERKFTLINGTEIDVTAQTMYRDSPDFLLITNLTLDGLNTDFRFTVLSIPYNVSIWFGVLFWWFISIRLFFIRFLCLPVEIHIINRTLSVLRQTV
jgi:hypothetical protein